MNDISKENLDGIVVVNSRKEKEKKKKKQQETNRFPRLLMKGKYFYAKSISNHHLYYFIFIFLKRENKTPSIPIFAA